MRRRLAQIEAVEEQAAREGFAGDQASSGLKIARPGGTAEDQGSRNLESNSVNTVAGGHLESSGSSML